MSLLLKINIFKLMCNHKICKVKFIANTTYIVQENDPVIVEMNNSLVLFFVGKPYKDIFSIKYITFSSNT